MPKGKKIDYTGKTVGWLYILGPVPKEKKKYSSNTKEWYCQCKCGKIIQLETRMISGTGKYTQQSCGCLRVKSHLVATSKIQNLSLEFIENFDDFEKYQFLHKSYVKINKSVYDWEPYKEFIEYFYKDSQFNKIYNSWKQNHNNFNTFYDLYKPSIDHKIPISRGGKNNIENLQFLTVFENLNKRDMTADEWEIFKQITNTKSDLYFEIGGKD